MLNSALLEACIFPLTDKNGLLLFTPTLLTFTLIAGVVSITTFFSSLPQLIINNETVKNVMICMYFFI